MALLSEHGFDCGTQFNLSTERLQYPTICSSTTNKDVLIMDAVLFFEMSVISIAVSYLK